MCQLFAFMVAASVTLTEQQQQQTNITRRRLYTVTDLVAKDMLNNDKIWSDTPKKMECRLYERTGRVRQYSIVATWAHSSLHPPANRRYISGYSRN